MERLRGTTMNQRVHKAMEYWLDAIKYVQERRKQELTNATKRQKENPHCIPLHDDKGMYYVADQLSLARHLSLIPYPLKIQFYCIFYYYYFA